MSDPGNADRNKEQKAAEDVLKDLKDLGERLKPEEMGNRKIRVIKPDQIKDMVLELLKRYGGLGTAELLQKIQELEGEVAKAYEKGKAEASEAYADIIKALEVERGRTADLESRLAAAIAEIDRLAAEKGALERALNTSDLRTRAELEKLVVELQARILELEIALDYFDLEEEPDPALPVRLIHEAGERAGSAPAAVKDRLGKLTASSKGAHDTFTLLREKMHEGKATVGVVVEMVKALKEARSGEEQARRISECFGGGS